jgi:hypothetical protein
MRPSPAAGVHMKEHPDIILGEAGFRIDTSWETALYRKLAACRSSRRSVSGSPTYHSHPVRAGVRLTGKQGSRAAIPASAAEKTLYTFGGWLSPGNVNGSYPLGTLLRDASGRTVRLDLVWRQSRLELASERIRCSWPLRTRTPPIWVGRKRGSFQLRRSAARVEPLRAARGVYNGSNQC